MHKHGRRILHDHKTGELARIRPDGRLRRLGVTSRSNRTIHHDIHHDDHGRHHRRSFVHIGIGYPYYYSLAGYPYYDPFAYSYPAYGLGFSYYNSRYGFSYGAGYVGYPYAWPVYAYNPLYVYPAEPVYGVPAEEAPPSIERYPEQTPETEPSSPENREIPRTSPPVQPSTVTPPEPLEVDVPTAEEYAQQGESAFRSGDYKEAVRAWRHTLLEDPKNGVLVLMLAQALFEMAEYEEAAGAVQQGILLLEEDKWAVVVGNYRDLYGNAQDYVDQLKDLENQVKEKSDSPAHRFLLAYHYAMLGYPKEAVRELDKLLELAPNDQIGRKLRDRFAAKIIKPSETDSANEKKTQDDSADPKSEGQSKRSEGEKGN